MGAAWEQHGICELAFKRIYSQSVKTISARFQGPTAVNEWMRPSSLFWQVTRRRLIVGYRRFDKPCRA
jgi:hypothetical protein